MEAAPHKKKRSPSSPEEPTKKKKTKTSKEDDFYDKINNEIQVLIKSLRWYIEYYYGDCESAFNLLEELRKIKQDYKQDKIKTLIDLAEKVDELKLTYENLLTYIFEKRKTDTLRNLSEQKHFSVDEIQKLRKRVSAIVSSFNKGPKANFVPKIMSLDELMKEIKKHPRYTEVTPPRTASEVFNENLSTLTLVLRQNKMQPTPTDDDKEASETMDKLSLKYEKKRTVIEKDTGKSDFQKERDQSKLLHSYIKKLEKFEGEQKHKVILEYIIIQKKKALYDEIKKSHDIKRLDSEQAKELKKSIKKVWDNFTTTDNNRFTIAYLHLLNIGTKLYTLVTPRPTPANLDTTTTTPTPISRPRPADYLSDTESDSSENESEGEGEGEGENESESESESESEKGSDQEMSYDYDDQKTPDTPDSATIEHLFGHTKKSDSGSDPDSGSDSESGLNSDQPPPPPHDDDKDDKIIAQPTTTTTTTTTNLDNEPTTTALDNDEATPNFSDDDFEVHQNPGETPTPEINGEGEDNDATPDLPPDDSDNDAPRPFTSKGMWMERLGSYFNIRNNSGQFTRTRRDPNNNNHNNMNSLAFEKKGDDIVLMNNHKNHNNDDDDTLMTTAASSFRNLRITNPTFPFRQNPPLPTAALVGAGPYSSCFHHQNHDFDDQQQQQQQLYHYMRQQQALARPPSARTSRYAPSYMWL